MKRKEQFVKKSVGAPLSDSPAEAERRLDNIRPREVSLVDSAANGRSFLIVKRRDDMKPKPKDKSLFKGVVSGGKEGEGEQDPAAAPAADPAQDPAATPAAEGGKEGEAPAADPAASEVPVEKGEFTKLAETSLSSIPVAKALVMEQKDMFMAMSDALMSFAMGMDMIRMDLMSFMNSDGKTGFMGTEVVKAALKKEFPEASESELVEKAGKKMKKDRLMKLKELATGLDSLIKELDDEQQKGNENVTKGGTVNNQGKGKNDQETNKSADGAAAAPATPATPASETPAAQQAAGALTAEQVGEIVTKAVDKAVAPLKTEIEALKNAPAEPAGEGAEGTEEPVNKGADGKGGKTESIFKGVIR